MHKYNHVRGVHVGNMNLAIKDIVIILGVIIREGIVHMVLHSKARHHRYLVNLEFLFIY